MHERRGRHASSMCLTCIPLLSLSYLFSDAPCDVSNICSICFIVSNKCWRLHPTFFGTLHPREEKFTHKKMQWHTYLSQLHCCLMNRPSYRKLCSLRDHLPDIPVIALTATAVPKWVQLLTLSWWPLEVAVCWVCLHAWILIFRVYVISLH